MASNIAQPTPNPTNPGIATDPWGQTSNNPPGSQYASDYSYSTSSLWMEAIKREIIDVAPQRYLALKVLYQMAFQNRIRSEHKYFEKDWQRPEILVNAWNHNTGVITLSGTYATEELMPATKGDIIQCPGGTVLIVTDRTHSAVADSATLTVAAQTGGSLTAGLMSADDYLNIGGPVIADGMNEFLHYDRVKVDEKFNYIMNFQRACRWGRRELVEAQNSGTTNYLELDKQEKIDQIRVDMMWALFNGYRGEFSIPGATSGNYKAKTMYGIYPLMVNAGAPHTSVTASGLREAFKWLAFESNHKAEGGTRVVYATAENITKLSEAYKATLTRFKPEDKMADLDLDMIKFGGMNFVMVPCELFRERTVFPETWKDKLIIVDQASLTPVILANTPHMDMGMTDNKQRGSYRDYTDWWVEAQIGLEYANPAGGFYIDLT